MKKYGWDGRSHADLMGLIVQSNREKVAERVLLSDRRKYESNVKRIEPKYREKKIVIPDTGNIIRRSPTIIKAFDKGKEIADTLRERIRKDVKSAMLERGITNKNGTVTKGVTSSLRKKLNETFDAYTKRDPTFKKPSNIEAIAVTETKTVINTVRQEYAKSVNASLGKEGFLMLKTWLHNRAPGGMPRRGHVDLNGVSVGVDDLFEINSEKGTFYADHPHAETLPASEVVCCRCELSYRWVKSD